MKQKIELCLIFILLGIQLMAQQLSGTVIYEQRTNLHRRLTEKDEAMKQMIPEFRTQKMQLLFDKYESLYKMVEEDEEVTGTSGGGGMMRMMRPRVEMYRNLKTRRKVDLRDFFGDKFRVEDTLKAPNWKITSEQKKILSFNCMKAIWQDTSQKVNIVAWFCPMVPVASGPEGLSQLPGLILATDHNDGEIVIEAVGLSKEFPKDEKIEVPQGGKKMTEEEFKTFRDKKMKEMGRNGMMRRFGN